jgi:hypothetical protein
MTPIDSDREFAVERGLVRRTSRYTFVVDVEVTDIQSGAQIWGRTKQLSLLGCGVDALRLFSKGTNVSIKLSYQGAEARAVARVVYASAELGMGMAFTSLEQEDERILEWWLKEYSSIPNQELGLSP